MGNETTPLVRIIIDKKLQIKKLIVIVRKINHQEMLNEGKEIFLMLQMLK